MELFEPSATDRYASYLQDVFDDEALGRILDVTSKLSKIAACSPVAVKHEESTTEGGLIQDEAAPVQKMMGGDLAQQTITVSTSFAETVTSLSQHPGSMEKIKSDMVMIETVKVVAMEPEDIMPALHHDRAAAELGSPREVDISEVPCSNGALDMSNSMDLRTSSSQLQSYLQLMRESISAEETGQGGLAKGSCGDDMTVADKSFVNKADDGSLRDNSSSGGRSSRGDPAEGECHDDDDEDEDPHEELITGHIGNTEDIGGTYTSMRSRWRSWLRDNKDVGASQDLRSQQPKLRQFNHPIPNELQASVESLPSPSQQEEEGKEPVNEGGHTLSVLDPVKPVPHQKAAAGSSRGASPMEAAQSDGIRVQNGAALAPVTPPRSPGPRGPDTEMHNHLHHCHHHQQQQHEAQPKPSEKMTMKDTLANAVESPLDRMFGKTVLLIICSLPVEWLLSRMRHVL